ncbi:hypothetical protein SprV_0100187700 [Sparganum proliferum]
MGRALRGIINCPSATSDVAIARLPQVGTEADLHVPPYVQETIMAVQQLSSPKAPGKDAIPAEIYKHGGPKFMDHLTALFQEMWRQGEVPQDFKDAIIVHLYKRKGNRQLCDNHRGLSLLNIVWKVFARILLTRPNNYLEQGLLPEGQCGFHRHRQTTDMVFAARQLQEKFVDNFTYLDISLSHTAKINDEVARRISKASHAFGRLQSTVWNRHGRHLNTKLKMCKAVILSMLMYGAEAWTVYKKQARKLDNFHLSCLRQILKLRWQDRIPDTDVLGWARILSIYAMLRQLQLRWSGHLMRTDDVRLPKRLFYGDVAMGSGRRKRPISSLHGHSEDFPEASADQLERRLSRPTDLEKDNGDRRSDNMKPKASPPPKPDARLGNPNCAHLAKPTRNQPDLRTLPADVPGTYRPCRTSSYQL